ncbi:zinc ribbon domain-containing protein [Saccharopolyspora erythraea]|uniref:FmdB family zinc ribbon protein n=1 Tax=Saccharopolyspora erythraea TaxID=1836 RepID=UPI001BAC724D|nr:zinc ribbon domain-containing protein [Saccharopolyspora erythraea]QUH01479.1 zinc ribbon domain-containing protein [Saccharopolyspora erythraea]
MATYEYDCPDCGRFDAHEPIGTAADTHECPGCRGQARRIFSAPHLVATSAPMRRARAIEERSADEPAVVSEVPGRPPPAPHPALSRLPRP